MKSDFSERTIYLQATTRGDNKVNKEIFVGVKKACTYNTPTNLEYVFDHGYAGDTYGLSEIVQVMAATTSNAAEGSTYQEWTGSCDIDMIIYERLSDEVKLVNKTETIKHQNPSPPYPTE
jgi:hypothetical protein